MAGKKPTDFDVRLGARLAQLRAGKGVSQKAIGAAIGISNAQIQKYEKGVNAMAARDVQIVAELLQVPLAAFYDAPGSDYTPPPAVDGISQERATEIRSLITAVAELLAPVGPKAWVPTPGARVICAGAPGVVTGVNMIKRMAAVRFDGNPNSGQEPVWRFEEIVPDPEADPEVILARMAEVPAEGTEERDFWLEAAEQHGFTAPGESAYLWMAPEAAVLKLISEARAQGHQDAMRVLTGLPAAKPETSPGAPPFARIVRDVSIPAFLDGDRIVIDCEGQGEPGLAGELYRALMAGGTAVAVVAPALAPPVTEADGLVRTDLSATADELRALLDLEPREAPETVIGTCKGEWRREAFDRWQAYDHVDQHEETEA